MGTNTKLDHVVGWVAKLRQRDLLRSAPLRLDENVETACDPDTGFLWIRGSRIDNAVLSLPFLSLFRIETHGSDLLFPIDSGLPATRLPKDLDWRPLWKVAVPAEFSATLFPFRTVYPVSLRVVRGGSCELPNMLRTSRSAWKRYAHSVPEIRLKPLHFAVSPNEVLVRGTPLPPISGTTYIEKDGIALPSGYCFSPAIAPQIAVSALRLSKGEVAIFSPSGEVECIGTEMFIPVTRASVQLSIDD